MKKILCFIMIVLCLYGCGESRQLGMHKEIKGESYDRNVSIYISNEDGKIKELRRITNYKDVEYEDYFGDWFSSKETYVYDTYKHKITKNGKVSYENNRGIEWEWCINMDDYIYGEKTPLEVEERIIIDLTKVSKEDYEKLQKDLSEFDFEDYEKTKDYFFNQGFEKTKRR